MVIVGLSIKLYLDHQIPHRFAVDLRRAGYDVVTSREVSNEQASDDQQLAWATAHGRTIFTQDQRDFPRIFTEWHRENHDHAGIIISVQSGRIAYGELLRRLLRLLDTMTADDMINQLEWLDQRWSAPDSH